MAGLETALHRQLKAHYAADPARREVVLDRYRIDALGDGELIEIQVASLAAIRRKLVDLLDRHAVRVVKPIIARKIIVHRPAPGAEPTRRRRSPRRGAPVEVFDDLIYLTRVFPHPRLVVDLALVEVEEHRCPPGGRRRLPYRVIDLRLVAVESHRLLRAPADLLALLPGELPDTFSTVELARSAGVQRWVAQRIAYCLRETGAVEVCGKRGNTLLYRRAAA